MIKVINIGTRTPTRDAAGSVRGVLGPAEEGTRVRVAMQDVEAGKTHRLAPSDQTQVAYVLDGAGARVTHTIGGLRIDRRARVLDDRGEPVPGLHAAGADAGGVFAGGYGSGLAAALVLGLVAAEDLAR